MIGNGRIVAQGTKAELLEAAGTVVRAAANPLVLVTELERTGVSVSLSPDGTMRTDADPAHVGQVALSAGIALTELRSADSAGLEEMFLELTAESQREGAAA